MTQDELNAERFAIDRVRDGKIEALRFMKHHLFANYCCAPDFCRNTKTPNKKCTCSKNKMLMKIVEDINYELHIMLNPTPIRSL